MGSKSYSKGISWIDDCRIPFVDEGDIPNDMDKTHLEGRNFYTQIYNGFMYKQNNQGRFPANILVSDDMLNDGSTTKGSGHKIPMRKNNSKNVLDLKTYHREAAYEDKGTNSRYYDIDKWFDKMINE